MHHRLFSIRVYVLLAILAGTVSLGAGEANDRPAVDFVNESLRGIGAEKTACPADVMEQVRAHQMKVVCARFEGSFERFEVRWGLQMIQHEGPEDREPAARRTLIQPKTDWERNGAIHDRVYLVGEHAIGVRFVSGDVLMVW